MFLVSLFCFLVPAKKASGHGKATTPFYCRALAFSLKHQVTVGSICVVEIVTGGFRQEDCGKREEQQEQKHYIVVCAGSVRGPPGL